MLKKLILIKDDEYMQFDCLNDLIDYIFGKEYKLKSQMEKLKIRYERAYTMCKMYKDILVVHRNYGVLGDDYKFVKKDYDEKRDFIIDDEIEFLRSMSKLKIVLILERRYSNIFIGDNFSNIDNDYIWVK